MDPFRVSLNPLFPPPPPLRYIPHHSFSMMLVMMASGGNKRFRLVDIGQLVGGDSGMT
jgi:hypothetical protein